MSAIKGKASEEVRPTFRNRIKALEYLDRNEIEEAPGNWRIHTPEQRVALQALLDKVGIAGAVVVYKTDAGRYRLIDGHLRHELIEKVPALILDVDDKEARVLLGAMDAIGELRMRDDEAFAALLKEMDAMGGLDDILKHIEVDARLDGAMADEATDGATPVYPIVPTFDEGYDAVVIFCRRTSEFSTLHDLLGLQLHQKRESKERVGTCRAIPAEEFIKKWKARNG